MSSCLVLCKLVLLILGLVITTHCRDLASGHRDNRARDGRREGLRLSARSPLQLKNRRKKPVQKRV